MSFWSRIKAAFAPREVARDRIITSPPLYQQFWRIGGGLTPSDVSVILRMADTGHIWRLVDLGNESRQKDTHLQSVLYTREIAISSLPWKIIEPDDATPQELEAVDLIRRAMDYATGGRDESVGLRPLVAHMQRGIYFGFSVGETDWRVVNGQGIRGGPYRGAGRRELLPAGFWKVPHRLFAFDGADGRLKWAPLGAGSASKLVDLLEDIPARFIQHQPSVNGDVAAREGLLRVLMWAALFRNWTLRDWLTLAELAWKPWRIGTYKSEGNDKDREALWNIITQLTTTGSAVKSDRVELDIRWPENGASTNRSSHAELYSVLGEGMSKAVLGQTLTTEASARGTQALGTVQNLVRQDYKRADAMACSATLMRDLWAPLVRMNLGSQVRVPAVLLVADEGVDRLKFAQAMRELRNAGVERMPAKWVRDQFGMPEPADDEELLIPITVELPPPAPPDPQNQPKAA